ncbi:YodC family protein [Acinetobacter variabilis]
MGEERKPKYQIGDIVKLNAGGPEMAIKETQPGYPSGKQFFGTYRCQWFAGKKLDHGDFPEDSLVLVRKQGASSEP